MSVGRDVCDYMAVEATTSGLIENVLEIKLGINSLAPLVVYWMQKVQINTFDIHTGFNEDVLLNPL